jgi:hypothetical protein
VEEIIAFIEEVEIAIKKSNNSENLLEGKFSEKHENQDFLNFHSQNTF